jgi:hypothetical protein
MFVYSLRASTIKFAGIIAVSVIALIALIIFIPTYEPTPASSIVDLNNQTITYDKVKTNDDRIKFLSQFGWTVDNTCIEEADITIPAEFDKVFLGYNEIQKQQGLNLGKYKRKDMTRYTYEITNYPNYSGTVYANLLVYRNKVVGGDICSADVNGFIHGFTADAMLP